MIVVWQPIVTRDIHSWANVSVSILAFATPMAIICSLDSEGLGSKQFSKIASVELVSRESTSKIYSTFFSRVEITLRHNSNPKTQHVQNTHIPLEIDFSSQRNLQV